MLHLDKETGQMYALLLLHYMHSLVLNLTIA